MKQPRAYIKNLDVIVDVQIINFNDEVVEVYFNDDADFVEYNFDEVILLENTGFNDKKGIDIYVGDIVKRTSYDGLLFYKEEVKKDYFDGSYFTASRESLAKINTFKNNKLEVIGNIYENKNLLGV